MASVNMFTAAVQDIPKRALEWTLDDFNQKEAATRSTAKTQQGRIETMFGRNLMDMNQQETSRGTQRSGWAGVRADRLRNDADFNKSTIEAKMRHTVQQMDRNRILATLGYTL